MILLSELDTPLPSELDTPLLSSPEMSSSIQTKFPNEFFLTGNVLGSGRFETGLASLTVDSPFQDESIFGVASSHGDQRENEESEQHQG